MLTKLHSAMDKTQLVALYVRVSSSKQVEEGYSLEAQEKVLRDEVLRQGKIVFKVYKDEGLSGSIYERPGLQALLNDAKKGLFSSVGIWMISRLSRKLAHFITIIDELRNADVQIFSLMERFDTNTPIGNFIAQMFASIAEMQRENIRQNVKAGSKVRAKSGKMVGGSLLGYTLAPDPDDPKGTNKYVILPEEAEIVRKIFDLYCEGNGLKVVARSMNGLGYRGKNSNTFSATTISGILNNQAYIGKVKYDGEYYEAVHEPIISNEQWDLAQKLLGSKKRYDKTIDYQYLLSGVIKCRGCGCSMIPSHTTRKNKNGTKKTYYYYSCGQYLNKGTGSCSPNLVNAKEADATVMNFISNYFSTQDWQDKIVERINSKLFVDAELKSSINQLQGKISRIITRQDKLLYEYEEGNLTKEELVTRDDELKAEIHKLELDLFRKLSMDNSPIIDEKRIRDAFKLLPILIQQSPDEEKVKLIRNAIKAVYVDDDRKVEAIEVYVPIQNADTGLETLRINIKEKEG